MTAVKRPTRWRRGEPLAAAKLNEAVDAIGLVIQFDSPRIPPKGARLTYEAKFSIVSVSGDYVTASMVIGGQVGASTVRIAKPEALRNSVTSRGSATYSYTGTDERTATVGGDTEDQVVVPAYTVGDVFTARWLPGGGTGVNDAPQWQDTNDWARAWAKASA